MYDNGYNREVDLHQDAFLNRLGMEVKKQYKEKMEKIWAKKADVRLYHKEDLWYMILEGRDQNGKTKVGLYQDQEVFELQNVESGKFLQASV